MKERTKCPDCREQSYHIHFVNIDWVLSFKKKYITIQKFVHTATNHV